MPTYTIDSGSQVCGDQAELAWKLYDEAFTALNAFAIQRHLMTRPEFDDVMADRRIDKFVAYDDAGALIGLAPYTNWLDAWPLISPAYFERRWPDLYAEQRIWYCGFVAVAPGHPGAYLTLIEALYRTAEADGGVIGLDVCRFNDEAHHMRRSIGLALHRISGGRVSAETADAQFFMTYETDPDGVAA